MTDKQPTLASIAMEKGDSARQENYDSVMLAAQATTPPGKWSTRRDFLWVEELRDFVVMWADGHFDWLPADTDRFVVAQCATIWADVAWESLFEGIAQWWEHNFEYVLDDVRDELLQRGLIKEEEQS